MANPLKLLSKLRRFDSTVDVQKYMETEYRQNLKAIEDAFNSLGGSVSGLTSTVNTVNKPYSLYVTKSGSMPTVSPSEQVVSGFDVPLEEIGDLGTFNRSTGVWTANREATVIFRGRAAIASNPAAEVFLRAYFNGVSMSTGWGQSTAPRGPTVSFGRRVAKGDQIWFSIFSIGTQAMAYDPASPIFFNIVQSGTT